jgi:hypothetical protein
MHLQDKSNAQINYDSKSCTDRILLNLAIMDGEAHSIPKILARLSFVILMNTKCHIMVEGTAYTQISERIEIKHFMKRDKVEETAQ